MACANTNRVSDQTYDGVLVASPDISGAEAGVANIVSLMTIAIDLDGYIKHSWSGNSDGVVRKISAVNNITQLIGWDAASYLLLECSGKGVAEGPVHFDGGGGLPVFSYCNMRLSSDRSHFQCYLQPHRRASLDTDR